MDRCSLSDDLLLKTVLLAETAQARENSIKRIIAWAILFVQEAGTIILGEVSHR
jgi:hypothetical protein